MGKAVSFQKTRRALFVVRAPVRLMVFVPFRFIGDIVYA
jgi:hypothetical protein